jgi:hypothetical protein
MAVLESAARESVNLGKDSNFLGTQKFLRSSNHRVWGRAFGSRPNACDVKYKSLARKLLKRNFFREMYPESTNAVIKM